MRLRVSSGPVRVSVFGKSDLGRTREHNEDTFLVADLSIQNASLQPEVRSHAVGPKGSLFMVADGMGGAVAGELASQMATDVIYRHLSTVWATDGETSQDRFAYRMKEALELANHRIFEYAREHPELRGMGTTATVAGVLGDGLWLAQIGDSRAYLARGGEVIQLTKDQSLMQRLVDAGELTQEEADQSERRNIILQALGPDARVKVDLTHQTLRRGDTLIICSDGLSSQVRREEIGELIETSNGLADLCEALIDLANGRGGPDNITVVVARFEGEGLPDFQGAGGVGYHVYRLPDSATPTAERAVPAAPRDEVVSESSAEQPVVGSLAPADIVAQEDPEPPPEGFESRGATGRPLLLALGLAVLAALLFYIAIR
jgi:serine/threonine protein phosphatase PrpC